MVTYRAIGRYDRNLGKYIDGSKGGGREDGIESYVSRVAAMCFEAIYSGHRWEGESYSYTPSAFYKANFPTNIRKITHLPIIGAMKRYGL